MELTGETNNEAADLKKKRRRKEGGKEGRT